MDILRIANWFKDKIMITGGDIKTAKTYHSHLCLFLGFCKKYDSPKNIPTAEIEKYILKLVEQKYSASYINSFIATAKRFYGYLGQPVKCKKLEYHRNPIKTPNVLTFDECMKMCDAKIYIKQQAVINVAYWGALRRQEIIDLKIEHISKNRTITIVDSKFGKSRVITVPQSLIDLLRKYYLECKPVNYLFNGDKGGNTQYSAKSIENIIKYTAIKEGINKKVHPHLMRSSRATHLLDNGASYGYVSEFLGHEKISTTYDYYHKLTIGAMQEQFDLIDTKLRKVA